MKTIIKNDTVVDALKREISICDSAVKRYEKILDKFELKYGLTSRQFSDRSLLLQLRLLRHILLISMSFITRDASLNPSWALLLSC